MTFEIALTQGYYALIDNEDVDLLRYRWYPVVSKKSRTVYATRTIKGEDKDRMVSLHCVIFERVYGYWPTRASMCDHEDGNGLNCTRGNLRPATIKQNMRNSRGKKDSLSGLKGSYFNKGVWDAVITVDDTRVALGKYTSPVFAHAVYCIAAVKHHGVFANLGEASPFTIEEVHALNFSDIPQSPIVKQRRSRPKAA